MGRECVPNVKRIERLYESIHTVKRITRLLLVCLMMALAACSPVSPSVAAATISPDSAGAPRAIEQPSTALTAQVTVPSASPLATALPEAPPTSPPAKSPTAPPPRTPGPVRFRGLAVLAEGLDAPDDLLLGPDGSIYVSNIGDGTVRLINPDGKIQVIARGLHEPEGMIMLPDGTLVIAEQGTNRLVRVDSTTGRVHALLGLRNTTGLPGVDGITLDTLPGKPGSIIIPDSPNGRLLRASLDGTRIQTIAGGFLRPTGAFIEPGGSILVADEDAGEVIRLHPDGSREVLARMSLADDVIEDPVGNIFAISISEGTVHLVSAAGEPDLVIVSGLSSPQGICFDAHGDLVVAEAGKNRLVRLQIRDP